ncbi:MAG: NAD(P)/FAD-dependent oxidoreductase [Salinirussus sp.]
MQPNLGPILVRRTVVGFVAGVPAAAVLSGALGSPTIGGILGFAFGLGYALAFDTTDGTPVDHALAAGALGVAGWTLVSVTALPLFRTGTPAWSPERIRALVPTAAAWVVACSAAGGVVPPLTDAVARRLGPVPEEPSPEADTHVVVVGGGFAGLAAARRFEALFGPDPTVELTLVSETNGILFTPMLAEVAAGSLAPSDITSPLRTSLRRTKVLKGRVTDVDFDAGRVVVDGVTTRQAAVADGAGAVDGSSGVAADMDGPTAAAGGTTDADPAGSAADATASTDEIPYDHLVVAVGSETNYFGMADVREFAFDFKTLEDAIALRNHVIDCFERAERSDDPAEQRALLTFVVAGAGFAGAELAGALNDLVHELLVHYPNAPTEEVRVIVAHADDRIMPALSESLSAYALDRMSARGVEFELGVRVDGADPETGTVSLSDGATIPTRTLVWTAGVRPNAAVERLGLPTTEGGAVDAEPTFAVPDREGVWAVGDCAAVTDPETGDRHPPTAQYATRAGAHLAENVHATVTGGETTPMTYRSQGTLAVIGHQTACAEIRGRQFSGLFAWLLWRAVYLAKLPGTERQIRVLSNWLVELAFSRDIVQTLNVDGRGVSGRE